MNEKIGKDSLLKIKKSEQGLLNVRNNNKIAPEYCYSEINQNDVLETPQNSKVSHNLKVFNQECELSLKHKTNNEQKSDNFYSNEQFLNLKSEALLKNEIKVEESHKFTLDERKNIIPISDYQLNAVSISLHEA